MNFNTSNEEFNRNRKIGTGYELGGVKNEFDHWMRVMAFDHGSNRKPVFVTYDNRFHSIDNFYVVASAYRRYLLDVIRIFGNTQTTQDELLRVDKAINICKATLEHFKRCFNDMFPNEKSYADDYDDEEEEDEE